MTGKKFENDSFETKFNKTEEFISQKNISRDIKSSSGSNYDIWGLMTQSLTKRAKFDKDFNDSMSTNKI